MSPFSVSKEVLHYTHAGEHLPSAALSSTPPFTPEELEAIKCYTAKVAKMVALVGPTSLSNPVLGGPGADAGVDSLSKARPSRCEISDYRHRVALSESEKGLLNDFTQRISVSLRGSMPKATEGRSYRREIQSYLSSREDTLPVASVDTEATTEEQCGQSQTPTPKGDAPPDDVPPTIQSLA
jgi:hypothetical protein